MFVLILRLTVNCLASQIAIRRQKSQTTQILNFNRGKELFKKKKKKIKKQRKRIIANPLPEKISEKV